jgi:hypothetical protein
MASVSSYFGSKLPSQIYGRKKASSTAIGIEIEVEKPYTVNRIPGWIVKEDGSLKNGKEYVICVWNDSSLLYLKSLFDNLICETNVRCSVHIHVDVTTFTEDNLKSLFILYSIFEKPLYRYSGKRWNNIFCVPFQTWFIANEIDDFTFQDFARKIPKYSGINSLPDDGALGTVEFRQMVGNTNPYYIQDWVQLLVSLVDYAKTIPFEQLKLYILNLAEKKEYWAFGKQVFKNLFPILNYSTFDKDVEEGILFAKLITKE